MPANEQVYKRYREVIYAAVEKGAFGRESIRRQCSVKCATDAASDSVKGRIATSIPEQLTQFASLQKEGMNATKAAQMVLEQYADQTYPDESLWEVLHVVSPYHAYALSLRSFKRLSPIILRGDPRFVQVSKGVWRIIPQKIVDVTSKQL